MKWISSKYDEQIGCKVYDIKHEKLLKFLGFRLHLVAEIVDYEFRMSFLKFGYSPAPMIMSTKTLAIPIPFMKRDHGLFINKSERPETYHPNGKDCKFKNHLTIRFTLY